MSTATGTPVGTSTPAKLDSSSPPSPRTKQRQASAPKDKKTLAAEDAAREAAAKAALLALIPPTAQPPSSADQTNIYHFTVQSSPFKLMCNSNALVGVVLDYIKEKSIKGVNTMLTSRLNRVRSDLTKLVTEEAENERSRFLQLADLTAKQAQVEAAIQRQAEAKANGETLEAPTSPEGSRKTPTPDAALEEKKDDGAPAGANPKRVGSAEKKKAPAAPASKKKKKGEVEEVVRSPEEEALFQITQAIEAVTTDYANKLALLAREREVLTNEEKQLVIDVAWVKQLQVVGSVVPAAAPAAPATRPPSGLGLDPKSPSPSPPSSSPTPTPSAGTATNSALAAALKGGRRGKTALANEVAPPLPQSSSLAPPGSTFLGIDLWNEDRTPLNLRLKPLSYASTMIKPNTTYQLVAVYSLPGETIDLAHVNEVQQTQQIPIHFVPSTTAAINATTELHVSTSSASLLSPNAHLNTTSANSTTLPSSSPTAPGTPKK